MKNTYLTAGAVVLLAACSEPVEQTPTETLASGIQIENMDTSVRPQDDFYRYVNGTYMNTFEIPSDRPGYNIFVELSDRNKAYLQDIIAEVVSEEHEAGSEKQKIADVYNSFMNVDRVNDLGITPIENELAYVAALSTKDELVDAFAHFLPQGAGGFFGASGVGTPVAFFVNQDAKDATRYAGHLNQSGLALPDRDFYFPDDERGQALLAGYRTYVETLFTLAGVEDPSARADAVIGLETALAEHQWIRTENRNRDKTYNKLSLEELQALTPNFDWNRYLAALNIPEQDSIIVRQPSYLEGFNRVFDETEPGIWKDYLTFKILHGYAPHLSEDFVSANFEFFGKTMSGTPEQQPRWKRGITQVNGDVGHALGKLYVARHFTPEAKKRMDELVKNLRAAFSDRLDNLEWMSAETREQARDKLNKFNPKIGYPDKWRDYSPLEITAGDLVGNVKRSRAFNFRRSVDRLGQPIDRDDWFINPQLVNAFYNPSMNEMIFPAGILQPPFFNLEADDAVNYGAIGAVIGHEMGHGFDDQGSKSDGDGNLRDWWTEADKAEFNKRTDALVAQYDQFSPIEGANVNGRFTLGENIGDLGGVTIAYHAYQISLDGKEAPVIDAFTGDQRFFIGWGQIWRTKNREQMTRRLLMIDSHSPGEFRANGVVMNVPGFYDAYEVKEDDNMYRLPEERVSIW